MNKYFLRLCSVTVMAIGLVMPVSAQSAQKTLIEQVFVDSNANTITITGQTLVTEKVNRLVVTLGDGSLFDSDITRLCVSPTLPNNTLIVCDFSGGGLPAAGEYLLTVKADNAAIRQDKYSLTIGAVGPVGPVGPQGEPGVLQSKLDIYVRSSGWVICPPFSTVPECVATAMCDDNNDIGLSGNCATGNRIDVFFPQFGMFHNHDLSRPTEYTCNGRNPVNANRSISAAIWCISVP